MKNPAYLPGVSVLALAAIAPATWAQSPDICYSDAPACRNIKVTVQGNQIVVDPATVTVTGRQSPVAIVWYLATPGYTFAAPRPVDFPANPAITRYQFMPEDPRFCYWWRSGTVYVCNDWNYETVDVNYTLKVNAVSGSSPSPSTGRVINN